MFFLNLSLGEFLLLFGAFSSVTVALYLLDRSRRRQVVATLRFWVAAGDPALTRRRRHIQQPWSLILQLLSIALLLAAIAELRIGSRAGLPRDHVLLIDTSAWMGARTAAGRTLMDEARERALRFLAAVPAGDRVMVVRADALTTPATGFESNRRVLREAVAASRPGSTSLDLEQAIYFARHAQALNAERAGEIVFTGTSRIAERGAASLAGIDVKSFRYLGLSEPSDNWGLRKLGVRRSVTDPDVWEIYVSARNYGRAPRQVTLGLTFGGAPAGSRMMSLKPGADAEATFEFRTRAAGELEARLEPADALPDDNRAILELPQQRSVSVLVYSDEPELMRPLLAANQRLTARFLPTSQYNAAAPAGLVVLDRFRPASLPACDSIWIEPPSQGSPVPVRKQDSAVKLTRWNSSHPLGAGLRAADARFERATTFAPAPDDIRVAESDGGPVIVARPGKPKIIVLGFHPARTSLRYELATPLLFANIVRWMAPDVFRRWDIAGGSTGTVEMALDPDTRTDNVRVTGPDGSPMAFTVKHNTLRFFSGSPGTVRVDTGEREAVYSLTLPELGESLWQPPAAVPRDLTGVRRRLPGSSRAWPWLAALGALGLLVEWMLYGRYRRTAQIGTAAPRGWRTRIPLWRSRLKPAGVPR